MRHHRRGGRIPSVRSNHAERQQGHGQHPGERPRAGPDFYADKLGLTPTQEFAGRGPGLPDRRRDDFQIYRTDYAGQAGHTIAQFHVGDIESEVHDLKAKGVTFEVYDMPGVDVGRRDRRRWRAWAAPPGSRTARATRCAWTRWADDSLLVERLLGAGARGPDAGELGDLRGQRHQVAAAGQRQGHARDPVALVRRPLPVDLHPVHGPALLRARRQHAAQHPLPVEVVQSQHREFGATAHQRPGQRRKPGRDHEVADRRPDGEQGQSCTGRHADRGGDPDGRRGRQPADDVPAHEDQPTADEPDAGHDLSGDAGRVDAHAGLVDEVPEAVLGHEHEDRGTQAHERMGAQPGALGADLPLDADERAQHQRQERRQQQRHLAPVGPERRQRARDHGCLPRMVAMISPTPPRRSPRSARAWRSARRGSASCPRPSRRSRTAPTGPAARAGRTSTPRRCGA